MTKYDGSKFHIALELSTNDRNIRDLDAGFVFIQDMFFRALSAGLRAVRSASDTVAATYHADSVNYALSLFFAAHTII